MFEYVFDAIGNGLELTARQMKLSKGLRTLEEFSKEEDIEITITAKGKTITFHGKSEEGRDPVDKFMDYVVHSQSDDIETKTKTTKKTTTK